MVKEEEEDEEAKKKKRLALVPYRRRPDLVDPISPTPLLRLHPSVLFSMIFCLENAVQSLEAEKRSLERENRRLQFLLLARRRNTSGGSSLQQIQQQSPSRSYSGPCSSRRDSRNNNNNNLLPAAAATSSSVVSVMAPSHDSKAVLLSQNTSSSGSLTPSVPTRPNSMAVLPPQALPEPCIRSSLLPHSIHTLRSVTDSHNHVSSEDVSVSVLSPSLENSDDPMTQQNPEDRPTVQSATSTTQLNAVQSSALCNPSGISGSRSSVPCSSTNSASPAVPLVAKDQPATLPSRTESPQQQPSAPDELILYSAALSTVDDDVESNYVTPMRTPRAESEDLLGVRMRACEPELPIILPLLVENLLGRDDGPPRPGRSLSSNDSLHVNVNPEEFDSNHNMEEMLDADEDVPPMLSPSSSSSSAESADGRGDAGSESSTPTVSVTATTAIPPRRSSTPVGPSLQENPLGSDLVDNSMGLGGKYGNLAVLLRPRPLSGHRYVISSNEMSSRRRTENRLPSWVPTYAQRIECILHQFLHESPQDATSSPEGGAGAVAMMGEQGPTLDYLYIRLEGNPPSRRPVHLDQSSDSEDNCVRSVHNSQAKKKKSCLKVLSREGSVGESRPKNLSWSQHVYVAQIPTSPCVDCEDNDRNKSRSCPGIYYMGEFSIASCPSSCTLKKKQGRRRRRSVFKKVFRCFHRCLHCHPSPPPPPYVQSTTLIPAASLPGLSTSRNRARPAARSSVFSTHSRTLLKFHNSPNNSTRAESEN